MSRHALATALLHSPIVPLLLAFVWWSHPAASWHPSLGGLLVLAWGLGLALEVSRKTVRPDRERPR